MVFEGLDHSGKSTLIKSLSKELTKAKIDFVATREPGGTPLGEKIRDSVLDPYKAPLSPEAEILLISASRRDHIEKVIGPALDQGKWVVCDRFWPSTVAFQGAGRGLSSEKVKWLNEFTVPKTLKPDLYILLDMPVAEKERRSQTKGHSADRFEIQNWDFHQRIRECYLKMAEAEKEKWFVLNALLSPEELTRLTWEEWKKRKWID